MVFWYAQVLQAADHTFCFDVIRQPSLAQVLDDTNRQLREERSARHSVNRTVTQLQLQLDRARDEIRWQGLASSTARGSLDRHDVLRRAAAAPIGNRLWHETTAGVYAGDQPALRSRTASVRRESLPILQRDGVEATTPVRAVFCHLLHAACSPL